jgi:hypothetical protein
VGIAPEQRDRQGFLNNAWRKSAREAPEFCVFGVHRSQKRTLTTYREGVGLNGPKGKDANSLNAIAHGWRQATEHQNEDREEVGSETVDVEDFKGRD